MGRRSRSSIGGALQQIERKEIIQEKVDDEDKEEEMIRGRGKERRGKSRKKKISRSFLSTYS